MAREREDPVFGGGVWDSGQPRISLDSAARIESRGIKGASLILSTLRSPKTIHRQVF